MKVTHPDFKKAKEKVMFKKKEGVPESIYILYLLFHSLSPTLKLVNLYGPNYRDMMDLIIKPISPYFESTQLELEPILIFFYPRNNIKRAGVGWNGEKGFLPKNEEADDGIGSMMMGGGSSLQAGQKVKVRIARGRVILTIKEGDGGKFECLMKQLLVKGLCIQS
ncbi:Uncharacterized protein Rs2_13251 [Raphanus sativus]|nr:Uncharacterized protein Rs2_13251 [Raphanus sativus]